MLSVIVSSFVSLLNSEYIIRGQENQRKSEDKNVFDKIVGNKFVRWK